MNLTGPHHGWQERTIQLLGEEKFTKGERLRDINPGLGLKLASSMGSGGKLDPLQIGVADFGDTYNCTLASIVIRELVDRPAE